MNPSSKVSDAEWEVMHVLWQNSPVTANDVVAALSGKKDWKPKTVKTLLNRLVKKGAVSFQAEGLRYRYQPKVKEQDCVRRESRTFLSRVFGDRKGEMLCWFVDEIELTPAEIDQLRAILSKKRK